jgi:pimeloyl-ACP methyl ester carboxylesterase
VRTAVLGEVPIGYLDVGEGDPVLWCHEYFGDLRSWAPQLNAFSRTHRNIAYSARGYPFSGVPERAEQYSQQLMIDDLLALMDHLGIERAVVAGLSMGGNVALNFGIQHPDRCTGLVIAGCGSGSSSRAVFESKAAAMLDVIDEMGMAALHRHMEGDSTRLPLAKKDPAGWEDFGRRLAEHSAQAASLIYREVQLKRRSILDLGEELSRTEVPSLVIFGDLDDGCVDPGLFMWRQLPDARLAVLPGTGHCVNLEEPELFNAVVRAFLDELA